MIGIIDYGLGNVKAFSNVYKNLNIPNKIIKNADELKYVDRIILPGVGAFDYAMKKLGDSGMQDALNMSVVEKNTPVLGVCVGMQILAESSEEGELKGLGWISGRVKKINFTSQNNPMIVPHMGWNKVIPTKKGEELFYGINLNPSFYFLHSYYFECKNKDRIISTSDYGQNFTSAVKRKNIYGIQFHPEKSHSNGIKLLKNFSALDF